MSRSRDYGQLANLAEMLRASASANELEQDPSAGQWQHGPAQMFANNSRNYSRSMEQWQHGSAQTVANNPRNHSIKQWQHSSAQTFANISQNYSAEQYLQHGSAEMVANNSKNNSVEQWPTQIVANIPKNHLVEPWYITIHLHGSVTKRPMRVSFWKCKPFTGFVTVINEILLELSGSQLAGPEFPRPFGWLVVADDGAIINGNYWEEFLAPCVNLWIIPLDLKFENAPRTSIFRPVSFDNSGTVPQIDPAHATVSGVSDLDSQGREDYSVQPQHQPAEEYMNVISNNINTLDGQNAILTTPEHKLTMNEFEAEYSGANTSTSFDAQSNGLLKRMKYPEAVALSIPDENNPLRQNLTTVHRILGDAKSRSAVTIRLFERDIFPSRYRKMEVPTSMTIGEFIASIGGTAKCRIQELKQAPKPTAPNQPGQFFAGATYMYGTQKTIEAAGWSEKAACSWGYFGVILRKALPPHPKSLAAGQ
ncbi:hypothetical protein RUND412_007513 [Rhizina undulata]